MADKRTPRRRAKPKRTAPAPVRLDPNYMLSLARGLSILRAFAGGGPTLSVSEASRITGLSRAATRRCLYTLQQLGYATGDNGVYALTPQVLTLGYAYLGSAPLARCAQPVLERVSEEIHECSSLAVLDGQEIVYVARAATRRIMSIGLSVGSRLPTHCTSMGRVLLAWLPEAELAAHLAKLTLVGYTKHTITSRAELRAELARVRASGYCIVDQELELGLRSIAVPVFRRDGSVAAALNSGVHAIRVDQKTMTRDFLPVLRNAAEEIGLAVAHLG